MKSLTKSTFLLIIFLLLSSSIFAQSSANASANVAVQLTRGLSITNTGGSLDFGEIIHNGAATPSITPENGATFEVLGHPNRAVTVSWTDPSLDNDAWVISNGGTNGTILFTADVEENGKTSTYAGATVVVNGNNYTVENDVGTGKLYLWVGGQLTIGGGQALGNYVGSVQIDVAY